MIIYDFLNTQNVAILKRKSNEIKKYEVTFSLSSPFEKIASAGPRITRVHNHRLAVLCKFLGDFWTFWERDIFLKE